jgi:hypothetical protein
MKHAVFRTTQTVVLWLGAFTAAEFGLSANAAEHSDVEPPIVRTQAAAKMAYANKLICTKERVADSNIKRTVCRTPKEIDQERAASQAMLNDLNSYQGRNYLR